MEQIVEQLKRLLRWLGLLKVEPVAIPAAPYVAQRIVCPACQRGYGDLLISATHSHASIRCHCGAEFDVNPTNWETTLRRYKNVKGEDICQHV